MGVSGVIFLVDFFLSFLSGFFFVLIQPHLIVVFVESVYVCLGLVACSAD